MKIINEKGFTLIEVAVIMILIVILVAISYPGMTTYIRSFNYSNDMRIIVSDLNRARSKAIQTGAHTAVSFVPNNVAGGRASYTTFVDNGVGGGTADDGIRNGTEEILSTRVLPQGEIIGPLAIAGGLNGGKSIAFNELGFAMGLVGGVAVSYQGTITTSLDPPLSNATFLGITVALSGLSTLRK